jgi:hypothetical protein
VAVASRAQALAGFASHLRILSGRHHHYRRPVAGWRDDGIAGCVGKDIGQAQQGEPAANARPHQRRVLPDTPREDEGIEAVE